jgi:nitrate reductase NapA
MRTAPTTASSWSNHVAFRASGAPDAEGRGHRLRDVPRRHERVHARAGGGALGRARREDIRMLGDLFADRDLRITSLWCMGMNQHTRGTGDQRGVHAIHLLSGHLGKPGRRADEPHRPAVRLRHRARGRNARPRAAGRVPGREREASCEGRGDVERARGPHQREARLPHRGDVGAASPPASRWRRHPHDLGPGHQPGPDAAEPKQAVRARAEGQGQVPDRVGRVPDRDDRGRRTWSSRPPCGSRRTGCRQLRAPHPAVVQDGEPPGQARDDCWQTIAVAHELFAAVTRACATRTGASCSGCDRREVPVWEWPRYYDVNVDEVLFEEYRRSPRSSTRTSRRTRSM